MAETKSFGISERACAVWESYPKVKENRIAAGVDRQPLGDFESAPANNRGWVQYYGAFQRSTLIQVLRHIERHMFQWVKRNYQKGGRYIQRAMRWLGQVARQQAGLFANWQLVRPFRAE